MKKVLAMLMAFVMVLGVLAGCTGNGGNSKAESSKPAESSKAEQSKTESKAEASTPAESSEPESTIPALPFEETLHVSVFNDMNAKFVGLVEDYADIPWYKWLAERLNVVWEFSNIPTEAAAEKFGLLISSKKWTDVIDGKFGNYPGYDVQAYKDGIIEALNTYMDEGYMPNMLAFYAAFPQFEQLVRLSTGEYLEVPHLRIVAEDLNSNGLVVRKDILDALGLPVPTTIDEWDATLRAVKAAYPDIIPFSPRDAKWMNSNVPFIAAWGMTYFEYNDGGTAKYGAVQDEFKDYLTLMHSWYEDGILDPDWLTSDTKIITAKVAAGQVFSYVGAAGGNLRNPWNAIVTEDVNSPVEYEGAPVPTLNKGETPKMGHRDNVHTLYGGWYMTTQAPDKYRLAQVMDFLYSEEANRTMYFGIEGENYHVDPDGRINHYEIGADGAVVDLRTSWEPSRTATPSAYAQGYFVLATASIYKDNNPEIATPEPVDENADELTKKLRHIEEVRQTALKLWASFDPVNRMPELVYTTEQLETRTEIYSEIENYVYEQVARFIMGDRDLNDFDNFRTEVYNMDLETALSIAQEVLDQYNGK
ncbi:MAG: extracellular solute-binding protein [Firmicutes bacterium]|nr:extracellular solute-binding protein [Bacillota bacterium]